MSNGHGLTLSVVLQRDSQLLVWIAVCVASLASARPMTPEHKIDLTSTSPRKDLTATISPLISYLTRTHSTPAPFTTTTTDGFKPSTTWPSLVEASGNETDTLRGHAHTRDDVGITSSSTTTIPETVPQDENTVNFLTLISIVALVVIIFITCLLVAAICPRGACYSLQPMSAFRHVNRMHFNFQQQASQTSAPTSPPSRQPSQIYMYKQQQRISTVSNENNNNIPQNMNESVSSEMGSSESENGTNLCCLKFQALPGRNGHLSVEDSNVTEDVSEMEDGVKSNVVQKYRKLTRFTYDTTAREEEQGSSERVNVVESDSDNLSKDVCLGKRKRPLQVYRQRQRLGDDATPATKEINIPRGYIRVKMDKYGKADGQIQRPEYFISQCPYCSCDNLMVNHNGRGLDLIGLHVSGKSFNEDSQVKRTVL